MRVRVRVSEGEGNVLAQRKDHDTVQVKKGCT